MGKTVSVSVSLTLSLSLLILAVFISSKYACVNWFNYVFVIRITCILLCPSVGQSGCCSVQLSVVKMKYLIIFKNVKNTFCECQISGSWFCGGNTWIYYNSVLVCTTPKTFTLINFLLIFINLVLIASINTFVWTKSYLVIVVTVTLSRYWRPQDDDV